MKVSEQNCWSRKDHRRDPSRSWREKDVALGTTWSTTRQLSNLKMAAILLLLYAQLHFLSTAQQRISQQPSVTYGCSLLTVPIHCWAERCQM